MGQWFGDELKKIPGMFDSRRGLNFLLFPVEHMIIENSKNL